MAFGSLSADCCLISQLVQKMDKEKNMLLIGHLQNPDTYQSKCERERVAHESVCLRQKLGHLLHWIYSRFGWLDGKMTGQTCSLCPVKSSLRPCVIWPCQYEPHLIPIYFFHLLQTHWFSFHLGGTDAFSRLTVSAYAQKSYPSRPIVCLLNPFISLLESFS